jgi:hypothetical protein
MLVVVLKACVTEMNEASCSSNSSTSLAKSASDLVRRSTFVDDDDVHPAGANVVQQLCQGGPVYGTAREATVVISIADQLPAFVGLAPDVGLRRLPLIVE